MSEPLPEVYLARHGETAWTISRQHTGRTDIPLTEQGERNARSLGDRLRGMTFAKVLVSPMQRARRTCELAGFRRPSGGRRRSQRVGLRRLRGAHDGRDPRPVAGLGPLPRRLPRGRVGQGSRRPRRRRDRPAARRRGPDHPVRSQPLLPGPRGALAGVAHRGRPVLPDVHGVAQRPGLRAYPRRAGHQPLERRPPRPVGVTVACAAWPPDRPADPGRATRGRGDRPRREVGSHACDGRGRWPRTHPIFYFSLSLMIVDTVRIEPRGVRAGSAC